MTDSKQLLEITGGIVTLIVIAAGTTLVIIIAKLRSLKKKQVIKNNNQLPKYTTQQATQKVIPNLSSINQQFGTRY